jgi:hypothetical protein
MEGRKLKKEVGRKEGKWGEDREREKGREGEGEREGRKETPA